MTLAGNSKDVRAGTAAPASQGRFDAGRLALAGVVAAVVGAVANLIIFFVARDALDISFVFPFRGDGPEALPAGAVVIMSVVPALLAAVLLWLLARFVRRPLPVFQAIALILLVLSFVPVLTLDDTDTSTRVTLMLMHVVAFAVIVGVLSLAAGRRLLRA